MSARPKVLFLCTHNAGRSQLGAALLTHLAPDQYDVSSAGVSPANEVNAAVAASLAELGIDIMNNIPRAVTAEDLENADIVVAMKRGLTLPSTPNGRYIEWQFPDPANWEPAGVAPLRDAIADAIRIEFAPAP